MSKSKALLYAKDSDDSDVISMEQGSKSPPKTSHSPALRAMKNKDRGSVSKSNLKARTSISSKKALKLHYWEQNEFKFKDDGTCNLENVNGLRRFVAELRS